jgi:hypothetical protein
MGGSSPESVKNDTPFSSQTIAELALNCQTLFGELLSRVSADSVAGTPASFSHPYVLFSDALGRFRAWANNIGAFSRGTGSLDYRVTAAAYLLQAAKVLLNALETTLKLGIVAADISKSAANQILAADGHEVFDESDDIDEVSDMKSLSSSMAEQSLSSSNSSLPFDPSNPLRVPYRAIIETIDKLFDLTMMIRGTSPSFQSTRALTHVENDEKGNEILPSFKSSVHFVLSQRYEDIPEWLIDRLTETIGLRRQHFYYYRAHKKHLSGGELTQSPLVPANRTQVTTQPPTVAKSQGSAISFMKKPLQDHDEGYSISGSNIPDTLASDPSSKIEEKPTESPPQTLGRKLATKTEISVADIFPGLRKKDKEKRFECYQCFHMQPASVSSNADHWK